MVRYYNPHESALRSLFRWRFTLTCLVEHWRGRIGWWHFCFNKKNGWIPKERVLPVLKNEGFTYYVCFPEGTSLDLCKHCILQTWNDFTSGTRGIWRDRIYIFSWKWGEPPSWTHEQLMNIRKYTPQISTDDGLPPRRLGVVGYIIIWLQKERWQLASGKFWDPLSMGPKKLRSSVFQMGEFWLYMICALVVPWLRMVGNHWLVNHVMSWIRNSFDSWGHGTDGQASSWLANRPGKFWRCFMLKKSGKILRRFIRALATVLLSHNFLWSFCPMHS